MGIGCPTSANTLVEAITPAAMNRVVLTTDPKGAPPLPSGLCGKGDFTHFGHPSADRCLHPAARSGGHRFVGTSRVPGDHDFLGSTALR